MIIDAVNPWGKVGSNFEPQRSDLWILDLTPVYNAIIAGNSDIQNQEGPRWSARFGVAASTIGDFARQVNSLADKRDIRYFARAVSMPQVSITPEVVYRDTRPYNTPGWDQPPSPGRMVFVHEVPTITNNDDDVMRSSIYTLLFLWRILSRAGRGGMSTEFSLYLDKDFKVNYGFDIRTTFLCGQDLPQAAAATPQSATGTDFFSKVKNFVSQQGLVNPFSTGVQPSSPVPTSTNMDLLPNGLKVSASYVFKNCWIGSLTVGPELSCEGARFVEINADFYADDVLPVPFS